MTLLRVLSLLSLLLLLQLFPSFHTGCVHDTFCQFLGGFSEFVHLMFTDHHLLILINLSFPLAHQLLLDFVNRLWIHNTLPLILKGRSPHLGRLLLEFLVLLILLQDLCD